MSGITAAGIIAAGLAGSPEQAQEHTVFDGVLNTNEIANFTIAEDPDGERLMLDGKTVFAVETADGATVYGISTSSYDDGPAVSGISTILANSEGEPITSFADAYEIVNGEPLQAEVAPLPGEELPVENPVAALPEVSVEAEIADSAFAGTAFEDGVISADEVATYEHTILTREEAEQIVQAGAEGTFAYQVDEWRTVETEDGTGYTPIIEGNAPVTVIDSLGNAFCGATTSSYADGVTVTGLNNGVLNTEETGPATCEDLFGLGR